MKTVLVLRRKCIAEWWLWHDSVVLLLELVLILLILNVPCELHPSCFIPFTVFDPAFIICLCWTHLQFLFKNHYFNSEFMLFDMIATDSVKTMCFHVSEIHKYHTGQQMQIVPEPSWSPWWVPWILFLGPGSEVYEARTLQQLKRSPTHRSCFISSRGLYCYVRNVLGSKP